MTSHALESLLSPLDGESPTGENLEYDPEFMALERLAAPKAERAVGDSVIAAEEPDWDKVCGQAEALLGRSKDLRVAVHLATAWMRTTGLPGWSAGLQLIRSLLEHFWDNVHPQLDAEDDNDPTARVNAVAAVTDLQGMLGFFRTTPFVQSPRLGRFTLRDLRIANGSIKISTDGEGAEPPGLTQIEACCMDCAEEQLAENVAAINAAFDHVKTIDAIFNEHVGTSGPDLKPLLSDIYEVKKFLEPQLAKRSPQAEELVETEEGETSSSSTGKAAASSGRIETPQDVIRRLDDICDYYARCEPSSPIPLLLRRAQRLVGLSFVDLMKDLAPGGMSELQVISGVEE